jgi:hypothetical protein
VRLSGCTLFGHDGSVNMLEPAFGLKLDRVGKIDIRDNVVIGHGAIVLPGATIGPERHRRSRRGGHRRRRPQFRLRGRAGAAHLPRPGDGAAHGEGCQRYPWRALIDQRDGAMDPALEARADTHAPRALLRPRCCSRRRRGQRCAAHPDEPRRAAIAVTEPLSRGWRRAHRFSDTSDVRTDPEIVEAFLAS